MTTTADTPQRRRALTFGIIGAGVAIAVIVGLVFVMPLITSSSSSSSSSSSNANIASQISPVNANQPEEVETQSEAYLEMTLIE
jgi:hypothetical protein